MLINLVVRIGSNSSIVGFLAVPAVRFPSLLCLVRCIVAPGFKAILNASQMGYSSLARNCLRSQQFSLPSLLPDSLHSLLVWSSAMGLRWAGPGGDSGTHLETACVRLLL